MTIRFRLFGTIFFLCFGLILCGQGIYIQAKACLAQILLEQAWNKTCKNQNPVAPWSWADTFPVAKLVFPVWQKSVIVLSGCSGRSLAFGPGHVQGSAWPGQPGNCVISAHRDTHFTLLKSVHKNDHFFLELPTGEKQLYNVIETKIIHKKNISILEDSETQTLTLVTCYPFDAIIPGGPLRYVVRAEKNDECQLEHCKEKFTRQSS